MGWRHCPVWFAGIINEEVHVLRNAVGLDWRQICCLNIGIGELVAHLYGPLASSCADIQDGFGVGEGCEIVFIVKGIFEDLVLEVKTIRLGGVIGEVIGCLGAARQLGSWIPREGNCSGALHVLTPCAITMIGAPVFLWEFVDAFRGCGGRSDK